MCYSGPTRKETAQSEAASYWSVARENDYFGIVTEEEREQFEKRILLEERAMDSFQNIVFCLSDFTTRYGHDGSVDLQHMTIVSHDFKQERFMNDHVPRAAWHEENTTFAGIDPDYMSEDNADALARALEVREGERLRGVEVWKMDTISGGSEALRSKRESRNHWDADQRVCGGKSPRDLGIKIMITDGGEEVLEPGASQPWTRT